MHISRITKKWKTSFPRTEKCIFTNHGKSKSSFTLHAKQKCPFTCHEKSIGDPLKTVGPTDLSEILQKFFAEVKTEKGQALTPSALTGIRAAIHRHLTCTLLSRNINILQDSKFMSANKMFEAKAKLFTKENDAKPKHKSSIQSGDMQKLNQYFMEGQNTHSIWKDAEKLVEFIWFSLCFHFARRGREGWRELTSSHLK